MAKDGAKMVQDGPRWSRWSQDGAKMEPRWSQDGVKMETRCPKMEPRWPKMDEDGAKMAQEGVKILFLTPSLPPLYIKKKQTPDQPLQRPHINLREFALV